MDVVGIDMPCVDFLVNVEKLPGTNSGAKMLENSWQGGGKVSTALVALGRLGASVGTISAVGDDFLGKFCIKDFETNHVDTSKAIVRKGQSSTMCVAISERQTGGRSILFKDGTCTELTLYDLDKNYITSAKYLHLTYINDVTRQAAKWAREKGVKVVIDADHYHQEAVDDIALIDVFIGSEFFYKEMFKDDNFEANCRFLQAKGPETVIFTRGEKGCFGLGKEGYFEIPAFTIKPVDTTGAGDVFHGAFIFGLLKGWDTKENARFASAVSAIKCTRLGGRAGIPDYNTVRKFLDTGHIDNAEIDRIIKEYRTDPFNL